ESLVAASEASRESDPWRSDEETAAPAEEMPSEVASTSRQAGRSLTDEDVERIARRVVELMTGDVVKNIAWEVVPDIAEMVVRERVRELEDD
ncbi:MAG TPA: hypothetical protein VMS12_11215, partial [Thermoanaerobaculia bacterium]|nr:hypothetical protein [Thermoanaerobaculia bacterium]